MTSPSSVITVNANGLNSLIKADWQNGLKNMIQLCTVYKRLTLNIRTHTV